MTLSRETRHLTEAGPGGSMWRGPFGRNLMGCVAVLACMALILFGPYALNRALPTQRLVPTDQPMALGALPVTVVPPPGARLDATHTRPDQDTVQFVVGGVEYWLRASEYPGSLPTLADRARRSREAENGFVSMEPDRDATTRQGTPGRQAGFVLATATGHSAVFVADGIAVWVDVRGTPREMAQHTADIEASVATLTIGRP
ncbi:MAG TPA: hypothetical protein VNP03_24560 [Pseudonocardia sp.]|nr:hypothetical protein [Pseudonocardia sp.]